MNSAIHSICKKTKNALLWMSLANEPFVVLYALIPFIIRKDLGASLTQLSILASLRPVLSLFSFYWSANLTRQRHRLRSNLIGAWLLARLPFLFVPWIDSAWYLIFCCAMYELLNRSGNPALMEMLKLNLQNGHRERIYNVCFVLSFLESIALGLVLARVLDATFLSWPTLLGAAALISLSSIFAQMRVPIPVCEDPPANTRTIKDRIVTPWKESFALMRRNHNFFRFQCGFMLGGVGLMLAAPSLALFCVDYLHLSHGEMTTGRSILMGLGVTISSHFWRKAISKQNIEQMLRNILIGFSLYLCCLYFANINLLFFYTAYALYGLAQAGSHLLWNLSGPLFAGQEDSSQFSRTNILMVGIRGAIAPALGGILCGLFGPAPVLLLGAGICGFGACYMVMTSRRRAVSVT